MTGPRRLPVRVAPLPGEALDSWLEALAARLAVPLSDLVRSFGLAGGSGWRRGLPDRTIALDPGEADAIAAATGLREDRVREMTLERYDHTAVILDPRTRMVNVRTLWGKSQGSRYCPDCLAGNGGRWQLRWRLSWSFACLAHRRLLADGCPRCGAPQRACGPAGYEPPRPGQCPSPAGPGALLQFRCRADLSGAATVRLPEGHLALEAQRILDELIGTGTAAFGVYRHNPQPALTALADIRAIAGRAIALVLDGGVPPWSCPVTGQIQETARALHRRAAAPAQARPGVNAPPAAPIAALGLTAACRVLAADSASQAADEIGWLIGKPRPGGRAVSPSTVSDWGRTTSPVMHSVQLAAIGPRMRPTDQLRYRTASPRPGEPGTGDAAAGQRAARIPALLWPSWAARICPPHATAVTAVRPALSAALILVGTRLDLSGAAELLGSAASRHHISKTLQLLQDTPQWHDVACALERLAGYLGEHDIPIDYQRRRQLGFTTLLPDAEWQRLWDQAGMPRDPALYAQAARRMLFQKISGSPAASGPFQPSPGTRGRPAESRLPMVLTPRLASGLSESAAAFLARQHITGEPVTWEPPVTLLDGLSLPGTDPGTVDLGHLHQLVRRDHLGPVAAARRLGTSRAVVDLLLDHDPAPEAALPRAAASSRRVPSREEFTAYCYGENLSLAEIARRTGISAGYASQLARDYGVPVRGLRDYSVSQHPVLTRDSLTDRYVTRGLSLRAIAAEAGMSKSAVKRWVRIYRLPAPETHFPIRMDIPAAAADAPPALRPAITGPGAWKRLRRLAAASSYSSLSEAGAGLGIDPTVLVTQINRLEREFGHRLLDRVAGQRTMQPTAYGEKIIAAVREASATRPADDIGPRRSRKTTPV
ncbi:MAG TPA: TniQ family protein [Streptosporangiaceae bacterium]|nr:TniQ family protein [Streptosporangiaceae bacterium]